MKTFGELSNIDDVYMLEVYPTLVGGGTNIRCKNYKRSDISLIIHKNTLNLCVLQECTLYPYKHEFHVNKKTLLHSIRNSFIDIDNMNILTVRTLFQQLFKMSKLHS